MPPSTPQLQSVARDICAKHNYLNPEFVGIGAFKETYRVYSASTTLALKICFPNKINYERCEREIKASSLFNGSYFCKVYLVDRYSSSDGHQYIYFVEEFLGGGTLSEKIARGPLTADQVRSYTKNLLPALSCLREKGFVHRDIKPDNVMFRLDTSEPVLVDFGIVRSLSDVSLTATWQSMGPGTPLFSSPEQLRNEKSLITWRSDQFSLAVTLAIGFFGRHPYQEDSMSIEETIASVWGRGEPSIKFQESARASNLNFLVRMLRPWPIERFHTPEELMSTLS